jgi:hypothetical protein
MSKRFGNSSAMPNLIRSHYRGPGLSGTWNKRSLKYFRIGWSVGKQGEELDVPYLPAIPAREISSLSYSQGVEALLIMAWMDLSLQEQALEWVTVFSRTFADYLAREGVDYAVEIRPLASDGIQQVIGLSAENRPRIDVVVESDLAVLQIEADGTTGVLYEFEGAPADLVRKLDETEHGVATEVKVQLLDEVALVHHVVACAILGYSYVRVPMYDRIRVPGYGQTAPLDWGSYDLAWPPVRFKKWKPGR